MSVSPKFDPHAEQTHPCCHERCLQASPLQIHCMGTLFDFCNLVGFCILEIIIVMCRRLDQGLTKFCMLCQTFGKQPVVQLISPWHFQNLKHKADSSIFMYNCLSYLIPVHLSYCITRFFFMIVTRIAIMIMYRTLCVQYYAHRENSADHPSII